MRTITNIDLQEACKRAAEIRGNWSAIEKRRRMGLPPDIPSKLRDFVLAPRVVTWPVNARV
jgi:hypothetical protein